MKIEILSRKENPLLERTEVVAKLSGYDATPDRNALAGELSKAVKAEKSQVFILKIDQHYGARAAVVSAQVYSSPQALSKTLHKKRRLRGKGAEEKKEEKPAAPKEHEENKEEKEQKTEKKEEAAEKK